MDKTEAAYFLKKWENPQFITYLGEQVIACFPTGKWCLEKKLKKFFNQSPKSTPIKLYESGKTILHFTVWERQQYPHWLLGCDEEKLWNITNYLEILSFCLKEDIMEWPFWIGQWGDFTSVTLSQDNPPHRVVALGNIGGGKHNLSPTLFSMNDSILLFICLFHCPLFYFTYSILGPPDSLEEQSPGHKVNITKGPPHILQGLGESPGI